MTQRRTLPGGRWARRWIGAGAVLAVVAAGAWLPGRLQGAEPEATKEAVAYFEQQVRPILVNNCFKCHGEKPRVKGGLNLTYRGGLVKGGELGPAFNADNPKASLLLTAIAYTDDDLRMPPKSKLSQKDIDTLTRWVEMGLPWTPGSKPMHEGVHEEEGPSTNKINDQTRNHWSFRPVQRPTPPKATDPSWVRTPIDAFVLAKLNAAGLRPAPPASKPALIRRAYYDLTGLPPTPAQVRAFVNDTSPDAYEKVIDELLASPHYGEKWGRHWLDLVHYAESNSFERDNPKPDVWRYRDYVIQSFNEGKPFDQFVREQLAGDELDEVTPNSIIATGYYRLGLWDDESADPPTTRWDEMDDWVTVTSQVMLGLTMDCARCHDHKIDPMPQEDYYRFVAFFRGVKSFQNGRDGMGKRFNTGNFHRKLSDYIPPDKLKQFASTVAFDDTRLRQLDAELKRWDKEIIAKLPGGVKDDFTYETNKLAILKSHGKLLPKGLVGRYEKSFKEREHQRQRKAHADVQVLCVSEEVKPPITHVQVRGNAGANGKQVEPGFPQVLGFADPVIPAPEPGQKSSGRRKALADWLVSGKNPLTARVMVNRIWQHHFGRGLVRTPNDFGMQGERPTHPLLLDWLASEFVRSGWRIKAMHKLIMTSSVYRMSGAYDATAYAKDPTNDLLWRFDLRRLTAEEVRDSILAMNGRLYRKLYGKSVYPPIPREVLAGQSRPGANWPVSREPDRYRRSVYIHVKRSLMVPMLEDFDAPDPDNTCPVRFATTQPTQALGMLNSGFVNDQAGAFAQRLKKEAPGGVKDQVALALALATQREPTAGEVAAGLKLIESLRQEEKLSEDDALKYYCLVVLNMNEFVYVD